MKSAEITAAKVIRADRVCPRCGAPLGSIGPEVLCGACLFGSGLAEDPFADPAATPATGPRQVGDYELLGEIARGGMGVVFRARQISLDRIVALKMILRGEFAAPSSLARFRQEAEAAAHLKHPNIVAIHEVGESDGHHFFSMDYIEGRSLSDRVRDGPLLPARAARYVEKISRAVHYAHEQGVLHRDLKPSNVLLDANDEPHVTDFGLAKRVERTGELSMESREGAAMERSPPSTQDPLHSLTLAGQVLGTPAFMPPEQAASRRGQVGPHSDVYSLGAVLYHLLTGRPPFVGPDVHAVIDQVLNNEAVAPRLLNPSVPRDLETITLKCLEKEPSHRYASAHALADELGRFQRDEPILARPVSRGERCWRWCRREPVLASLGASVFLLLLVVAIGSSVAAVRIAAARDGERKARGHAEHQATQEAIARRRAQDMEREARTSDENARAVIEFFRSKVLAAARPVGETGGLGYDATIRAALEAAEPEIARSFHERPLVEAEIRQALGMTWDKLGGDERAIVQWERALEIRRAHPNQDFAIAALLHNLGEVYRKTGRYSNAIAALHESIQRQRAREGSNSPGLLPTKTILAGVHLAAGDLSNGLGLARETLVEQREASGLHASETVDAMNTLAEGLSKAGRFKECLEFREHVHQGYMAALGSTHRKTLTAQLNLAHTLAKVDRVQESVRLYQATLPALRTVLGPNHPLTLSAMSDLAHVGEISGLVTNVLELHETVVRGSIEALGPDHPETLISMNNLAIYHQKAGRYSESIQWLEQVVRYARVRPGPDHPNTLQWLRSLAASHVKLGQFAQALRLLEEEAAIRKRGSGLGDGRTQEAVILLAQCYLKLQRVTDAESVVNELLINPTLVRPEQLRQLNKAVEGLVRSLKDQGKSANAEVIQRAHRKVVEARNSGASAGGQPKDPL